MYASHNLLIIYIFLPITDNVIVCIMGLMTTLFYLIVMTFVSYAHEKYMVVKILSEFFFFMCINLMGLFFRLTNEIDIRRTFIDRRECVQKNLSLKFERNQEVCIISINAVPLIVVSIISTESTSVEYFTGAYC